MRMEKIHHGSSGRTFSHERIFKYLQWVGLGDDGGQNLWGKTEVYLAFLPTLSEIFGTKTRLPLSK